MKKLDLHAEKEKSFEGDAAQQQQLNNSMSAVGMDQTLALSSNPISGLRAAKPRDFEILVNLVDFTKLVVYYYYFKNYYIYEY